MSRRNYNRNPRAGNNLTRGCESLSRLATNLANNLSKIAVQLAAEYDRVERLPKVPPPTGPIEPLTEEQKERKRALAREYGFIPLV